MSYLQVKMHGPPKRCWWSEILYESIVDARFVVGFY